MNLYVVVLPLGCISMGFFLKKKVVIPIYCGFFPEKQLPKAKRGIQWHVLKANKPFFAIALLMG